MGAVVVLVIDICPSLIVFDVIGCRMTWLDYFYGLVILSTRHCDIDYHSNIDKRDSRRQSLNLGRPVIIGMKARYCAASQCQASARSIAFTYH